MQKCRSCGTESPDTSRFCGECGSILDAIVTDAATTRSNTPQLQSRTPEDSTILASRPPYSNYPTPSTPPPPPPAAENEDGRISGILPSSPLYDVPLVGDALLGSGQQAYTPGAPAVQGTPQIGNAPSLAGSPTINTNELISHPSAQPGSSPITHPGLQPGSSPITHPGLQPGNTPITHPGLQPGNSPITHPGLQPGSSPVSHPGLQPGSTPITHPISQPGSTPVSHPGLQPGNASYPQTGSQPTYYPPKQPGIQEHRTPRPHHEHRSYRPQHTAERMTKVAGGSAAKTIMLVVAVVVVAAGVIGTAAHFLSPSQPLISITSNYTMGNTPAGASGTTLHISGQNFSGNSAITILLDGNVAPGNAGTQSDSNGKFSADVTITDAWSAGTHTLTARDASNKSTQNGVTVQIVSPGQAHTPGPNGAPPDDASFKVTIQIQGQTTTGDHYSLYSMQATEVVTGHPDPMGGTVCQPEDNGQPSVTSDFTVPGHAPFKETSTYSCSGGYKGGKLTLTEMLISDVFVVSQLDGTTATCTMNASQPQTVEQVSGSYTGNNTFSGTITYPAIPDSIYSCTSPYYRFHTYEQHNWTGQVTDLQS